ncbi:MAG: UbiA family prenyltransferase [Candidatus Altiarchaeota archaeon]|nr:UbiA family prenyltransferase [Candidatus Altiarchaeota archaeon]
MGKHGIFYHIRNILDLIRLRNALMSFFGVYIGAMLFNIGYTTEYMNILLAAVSTMLVLGGGNTLNDYFDYLIDKVNKPHRPIPSGRVSRSDAFILSLVMFLIGLAIAKSINIYCLYIAVFNTFVLVAYARYGKRLILIANISISYLVSSVFIYGAASVYEPAMTLNFAGVKLVLILSVCSFFTNLGREIIKDIEDLEGDKKAYCCTLPIEYGAEQSKRLAYAAVIAAVLLSYVPIFLPTYNFNELMYAVVVTLANVLLIYSMKAKNPSTIQKLLIIGMTLALIAYYLAILKQIFG